jgi:hypothetical protein
MYDIEREIPSIGETVEGQPTPGEAVQVVRLGWDGSEDRKGNPMLQSSDRGLNVSMAVGDPIIYPFDALAITNDNANAVGTTAILRVYEDAERAREVQRRRSMVARAPVSATSRPFTKTATKGPGESFSETLVPSGRDRAERLLGCVCKLSDSGNVKSGYEIRMSLRIAGKRVRSHIGRYGPAVNEWIQLADGLLIPKDFELDFKALFANDGEGEMNFEISGVTYRDANSPVPPK